MSYVIKIIYSEIDCRNFILFILLKIKPIKFIFIVIANIYGITTTSLCINAPDQKNRPSNYNLIK